MALNPDMVIRLTKPKHDQNPASVLETESEDPKSQKDSPTTVLCPTMFSKKPPKPTSPYNEKQVGFFDNERIADAVLPFKIV